MAPKKVRLREAEEKLSQIMAALNEKRSELRAIENKFNALQNQLEAGQEKKAQLEFQVYCNIRNNIDNYIIDDLRSFIAFRFIYAGRS